MNGNRVIKHPKPEGIKPFRGGGKGGRAERKRGPGEVEKKTREGSDWEKKDLRMMRGDTRLLKETPGCLSIKVTRGIINSFGKRGKNKPAGRNFAGRRAGTEWMQLDPRRVNRGLEEIQYYRREKRDRHPHKKKKFWSDV